ncbi:MAG: hypothetical protein ACRCYQ_06990 [Nocardioides sp.]
MSSQTCWDGTTVADRSECPAPSGAAGAAWVFSSYDPDRCTELDERAWACGRKMARASITYRNVVSVRRGITRYSRAVRGNLLPASVSGDDRFLWRATRPDANGDWLIAVLYRDDPWAVEVRAKSLGRAKAALRTVRFRDADELSRRTATGDSPT